MPNDIRRTLLECRNVDIGIEARTWVRDLNTSRSARRQR
jgi:hypothetical protein